MPKPQEIATLVVNGQKFEDWESIWVHLRWAESFSEFRFEAAERDKIIADQPASWARRQFKPGDSCLIQLAGTTVITGWIEVRQVAYDANSHGVQLIGRSRTAHPARSSVDTKTGNFDGMNIVQVAEKVLSPYPTAVKLVGTPNLRPFDKLQNQPGETIWDFLERCARPRGMIIGTDSEGNFLLIGDHVGKIQNQLIEGKNIKACQAVMDKTKVFMEYRAVGQTPASDGNSGTAASEQEAKVGSQVEQKAKSLLITPAEQPVKSIVELQERAKNEALWHDGTIVQVTIVTQGWLSDGVNLWWPGNNVYVFSPMAMLNMTLKIQEVTFTQDNRSGTQTTLLLVPPWALKDGQQWNAGDQSLPGNKTSTSYTEPTPAQASIPV